MESQAENKHYNRLQREKSPYLLQHAENPVDWYPWSTEAFEKAQKENKPVFLSIGYSTCHWCHVMAHESFEDPEVATLMNQAFISIKVDREERPDIDSIYMGVCQLMTGSGGWPLTIIMTPEKEPFFAATYIPKQRRLGMLGMIELIPRIQELWGTRRQEILESAGKITSILQQSLSDRSSDQFDAGGLQNLAFEQTKARFDSINAGFGDAPKFPMAHTLSFLLRYWKRTHNEFALAMVERTLQAMRRGGIYDHIGFGFHRYSTDATWLVPHFEKMLYDQAMLAIAYIEAYQATGNELYRTIAREIFEYVLRDMTSTEGGFYSAEDADSEGIEGKFYVWNDKEILDILRDQAAAITRVFNVTGDGNFTEEATGQKTGVNILHLSKQTDVLATELGMSEEELQDKLEAARLKLFAHRERRIRPHKDDKVLTDWNGLMIAALAKGSQAFDEPNYVEAARNAADFILQTMRTTDGRLLHRYRDGEAAITPHVNDYSFLIWGLLELYEATFEVHYLETALDLTEDMIEYFWDETDGGFYSTPSYGESLLLRPKEIYDGAIPSGNSVAMLNLLRLGSMVENHEFEEKAAQVARTFSHTITDTPVAYHQLMCALDFLAGPSCEVVIAGDMDTEDTRTMLQALRTQFIPNRVVLFKPGETESPDIEHIVEFIKNMESIDGKTTAYVCRNHSCTLPTTDKDVMMKSLMTEC